MALLTFLFVFCILNIFQNYIFHNIYNFLIHLVMDVYTECFLI
nr:MAG TPA: hypothetical protein [Caudoviricetes sp.]